MEIKSKNYIEINQNKLFPEVTATGLEPRTT